MQIIKVFIYTLLSRFLNIFRVDLIHFTKDWRVEIFDDISTIKKQKHFLMPYLDAYNIASLTQSTNKIPGDIVEVGCYQGASAKLISKYKSNKKTLYAIDSFEGLPAEQSVDRESGFKKGDYKASQSNVEAYLKSSQNTVVLSGFFPQANAEYLSDKRFSMVHLDVDLYEPTKECLDWFYNRMSKGGVIVSHDFQTVGIRRAFSEFFEDKPEIVIEMMEHQGVVVKM